MPIRPFLDLSTLPDDSNKEIAGYTLARAEHPSNFKRGSVCICYRNTHLKVARHSPFKGMYKLWNEACINFEMKFGDEIRNLILWVPTPKSGQTQSNNFVGFCGRIVWVLLIDHFVRLVLKELISSYGSPCQPKNGFKSFADNSAL